MDLDCVSVVLGQAVQRRTRRRRRRETYGGENTPVFRTSTGKELRRATVYGRVVSPAMIEAGLFTEAPERDGKMRKRPLYCFHGFRHFCGSALPEKGRNLKQVSVWLGHANVQVTANIYLHLLDSGVGDADFFDDLFPSKTLPLLAAST